MKQNQKKEENQTGQYKQKIQNYIKHQQRNPRKQNLTIDKILTQMIIDSLNLKDNEKFIFNIFDDIKQPLWSYQISKQMLNKIINKNDKIQTIILYSLLITDGYFNFKSKKVNLIYVKVPQVFIYQSFFLLQSTDNFCLLFEVGIHKSVNDSKKQTQDICFDISQKITFIDIFFYQKGQEITEAILEYQRNNFKNFYRSELNQIECISIPLTGTNAKQQSYLFQIEKNSWPESTYQLKDSKSTQWIPLSFKQLIEQKQNMLFQGKFMKISFHKNITNQYLYEEIGNQNKYKLTQFADFNSAGQILDLLSKSQHFKIKLQINLILYNLIFIFAFQISNKKPVFYLFLKSIIVLVFLNKKLIFKIFSINLFYTQ